MIEYTDSKIGKIKVLNVTEARAHFATVLSDENSHYVITKNNKPLRVIIDYTEFERLRAGVEQSFTADDVESANPFASQHKTEFVERKSKKTTSRVAGILESNITLANRQGDKRQDAPSPRAFSPAAQEMAMSPNPATPDHIVPETDDYFFSATDDDVALAFPETEEPQTETMVEESQKDEETPPPATTDGTDLSVLEKYLYSDALTETQKTTETLYKKNTQEKAPSVSSVSPPKEVPASPEQQEYFKKYKKLYEPTANALEPAMTNEQTPVPSVAKKQEQDSLRKTPANYFLQQAQEEEVTDSRIKRDTLQRSGSADLQAEAVARNKPELPSLKDLLAALEQEKLSYEENNEPLDKDGVETLMERITED